MRRLCHEVFDHQSRQIPDPGPTARVLDNPQVHLVLFRLPKKGVRNSYTLPLIWEPTFSPTEAHQMSPTETSGGDCVP